MITENSSVLMFVYPLLKLVFILLTFRYFKESNVFYQIELVAGGQTDGTSLTQSCTLCFYCQSF